MIHLPLDIWNDLMQPIYWVISGILVGFHKLYSMFLNPDAGLTWVLSIISLTVIIRSAMIPLFVKQINSSRRMQLLQPKMKAIQEKYGTDRERLGQEQMKLYKDEGVNPFASCLPLLVQMPVFIGLFNVLNFVSMGVPMGQFFVDNPALVTSLQKAEFLGARLAGSFLSGGGFGDAIASWGPTQTLSVVLTIGLVVSLFITQLQMMRKNMPPEALTGQMAQTQKTMLYVFPLMYLVFGLAAANGVMIYWMASNLWTLAQQWILIANSPTPNTPAYLDWEARMIAQGKDPQEIIEKRLGVKKPRATASEDPTKVARQSTNRETALPPVEEAEPGASGKQKISRQQPSRQPRASRKKS